MDAGDLVERIASSDGRIRVVDGDGRVFSAELEGVKHDEEHGEFTADLVSIEDGDVPLAQPPRITSSTDYDGEWEWPTVAYYEEYGEVSERVRVDGIERL